MELDIENKVVGWLWGVYGLLSYKMNGTGRNGWPDRMVPCPLGWTVWIEFKDKGKISGKRKGEKLQKHIREYLLELGHVVKVFDSEKETKEWFKAWYDETITPFSDT